MSQLAFLDLFTVPTATFRVIVVFVALPHDRRRIVHGTITAHATAVWSAQQLREAWPWDEAPRFFVRDRDDVSGRRTASGASSDARIPVTKPGGLFLTSRGGSILASGEETSGGPLS